MPLEKEEKYMEEYKATIVKESDEKVMLSLSVEGDTFNIVLTEDNPNNVKSVFNGLLQKLKSSLFKFELESDNEDLYYFISKEYISQLNSELLSVYNELSDYNLLDENQNGEDDL